jgi:mono/diheme cytochrome c family protein
MGMTSRPGVQNTSRGEARYPIVGVSLLLGLALGGAGACGDDTVTWYQDVAPLLSQRCTACHVEGGMAPFPLNDYETARAHAQRILQQVESGAMPPFDAREEKDCTPRFGWVEDPRLSKEEKRALSTWVEQDFPIGVEEQVPTHPLEKLANISRTLTPEVGFITSGDKDQYICYVLDPQVTEPATWLTGLQLRPDVVEVVHHAVINSLKAGPAQDELVGRVGIGKPYDCAAFVAGDTAVHTWTPGNQPLQMQPGVAALLTPGSKLVVQLHYHPASRSYRADKTSLDLQFSKEWPSKVFFAFAMGNAIAPPDLLPGPNDPLEGPVFGIPANADKHTERMRLTVPGFNYEDVRIISVNPHMHMVGTHVSATLERPEVRGADPQKECLANGKWNFDWQRTYIYDASLAKLPSIAAGDVLELYCEWTNTLSNPFVQRLLVDLNLPPRPFDVAFGVDTAGEMCIEIFGVVVDAPPPPSTFDASFTLPPLLAQ